MVSDNVEIVTRSYKAENDGDAVRWECDGSTEFSITSAKKKTRGTDVILHANNESEEFLGEWSLKEILEKDCKFLPVKKKLGTKENDEEEGGENWKKKGR